MRWVATFLVLFSSAALAHGGEEQVALSGQMAAAGYGFAALVVLGTYFVYFGNRMKQAGKKVAFLLMAGIAVGVTGYIIITTVLLNASSATGGPVHWHADFEIWACGERVVIKEPEGLSNKVGTNLMHHHNDNRIHVEGVLLEKEDASLGAFFEASGGTFNEHELSVIVKDGTLKTWRNGDTCPDGTVGHVQLFVNDEPNTEYGAHVIAPYARAPPGDVLKIVFGRAP